MPRPRPARRILLTGASRGIGRATAFELAARGNRVVLAARDSAVLSQLVDEIAERYSIGAEFVTMDVTDECSVQSAIARVLSPAPLDVVVNNAGIAFQGRFLDLSPEQCRWEWELNYVGALRVTRALLPHFVARGRGHVVNVSSLLGSVGSPTTANYGASKAALEVFSHGLRAEVAADGIDVSVFVAPHAQTELGARTEFRGVRSLPVSLVARALARTIDTAPRRTSVRPVYPVLLALAAWWPQMMERQLAASVRHLLVDREDSSPRTPCTPS